MIISHEKKFIYIATPKTGTTSIHHHLKKYNSIRCNGNFKSKYFLHANTETAFGILTEAYLNPKDYFIFSCTRNPWERCVSEYFFICKRFQEPKRKLLRKYYNQNLPSFEQWIIEYNANSYFPAHDSCQVDVIQPHLTSTTMRFENLQEDFNIICDKIGIPRQKLPHRNKINHKHYTEYYDEETKEIVAEKYAKDIEYFGYEFGE